MSRNVTASIIKSDRAVSLTGEDNETVGYLSNSIQRPYETPLLEQIVRESTILPQCKNAYKRNIAGFGIGVKFKDESLDPTPEMEQELKELEEIIEYLSIDKPLKEVFETVIDERETYGFSFIEVIENEIGQIAEIANVETPTIEILRREDTFTNYTVYRNGKEFLRTKRFRKYRQKVGKNIVYFKEFGDPRKMDALTGEYKEDIPRDKEANSLIKFSIGYGAYGTPRWEGPMLTIEGARKAEKLNWNYFKKGRHTPLMIIVKGGSLTDDAASKLQEYVDSIEGENSQHGFLVLEAEKSEQETAFEKDDKVDVEIKSLADILQKDELFQDYLENHRRKVQSSFNLPDIYVGYSQDYNVATAREVVRKTEEQVFIPERESLEWIINNVILGGYLYKFVEVYFFSPDVENTDHQFKMFSVASKSMTPNQSLKEYYTSLNKKYVPLEDEWANIPQYVYQQANQASIGIEEQIQKALNNKEDGQIIDVLKSVKKALNEVRDKVYP